MDNNIQAIFNKRSLYSCINPLWPRSLNKSCLYTGHRGCRQSCAQDWGRIGSFFCFVFRNLVYELQVLMDIRTLYVRVQSQTFVIFVLWLLWNQLLVARLPLVIWINVDPFIGDPLSALGDHAASMQSVFILLSHPTYWEKKNHLILVTFTSLRGVFMLWLLNTLLQLVVQDKYLETVLFSQLTSNFICKTIRLN